MHEGLGTLELALPLVSTSKGPHAHTERQKNGAPARLRSANGPPRKTLRIAQLPCRISRQHRKQAVSEVFAQKARRDPQGHRPLTDGSFVAKTRRFGAGERLLRRDRVVHRKHNDGRRRPLYGNHGGYEDRVGAARVFGRDLSLLRSDAPRLRGHLRSTSAALVLCRLPGDTDWRLEQSGNRGESAVSRPGAPPSLAPPIVGLVE